MAPLPLTLAKLDTHLASTHFNSSIPNTEHHLQRRWQFSDGRAHSGAGSWNPGWDWSQARGWTGNWEVGKLFMWTFMILGCMFGGFVLVALIFCFCGMVDDRRIKRRARRFAKRRARVMQQQSVPVRGGNGKTAVITALAKKQDKPITEEDQIHVDNEAETARAVSKGDDNIPSRSELIEAREELIALESETFLTDASAIPMESIPMRQMTSRPSDLSKKPTTQSKPGNLHAESSEQTSSFQGLKNVRQPVRDEQEDAITVIPARDSSRRWAHQRPESLPLHQWYM